MWVQRCEGNQIIQTTIFANCDLQLNEWWQISRNQIRSQIRSNVRWIGKIRDVVDAVENQINVFSLWAWLTGPYLGGIRGLCPKLDKTDRPKHQQPFLIGTISHFIIISLSFKILGWWIFKIWHSIGILKLNCCTFNNEIQHFQKSIFQQIPTGLLLPVDCYAFSALCPSLPFVVISKPAPYGPYWWWKQAR